MKRPGSVIFRKYLPAVIFFTLVSTLLFSQEPETCAEKLERAQVSFERGQFGQIPDLLTGCLKSGFKKEEELLAYKLLIQTYLVNDKIGEADSAMNAFLKRNPEYRTSPTDHASFVYLFNKFNVKPVVMLGFRVGTNVPFLTFVKEDLLAGEPGKSDFRSDAANLYISADARFKLGDNMELAMEAGYSTLKFTNIIDETMSHGTITYSETQQRLEIPVCINYNLKSFGKFTLYGRGGLGAALNLSTKADLTNIPADRNNPNDRTGETLNRKDSRISMDVFCQIGAGMKYKIPKGFLFAEMRSSFGVLNQNVEGGTSVDITQQFYRWSDPDFRLNSFNINIGYTYILYKPTKKKE